MAALAWGAGSVNAPARITNDIGWTPAEIAHRRAISMHCAGRDELEMATRVQIAIIRDQAAAGVPRASDSSATILSEISRLATAAVYADFPPSKLMRIRSALHFTMEAARMIERVSRNG